MGRLERLRKLARLPRVKRFSLRSLLLCVLLIGSGFSLWYHWGPWEPVFRFEMGEGDVFPEDFVPPYDRESDTFWGVTTGGDLLVWNGSSGACALRKRIGEGKAYLGYKLPGEIYLYLLNEKSMVANVIDLREKAFVIEFTLPNGKEAVSAIQSMDGQWLACGSDGNVVQVRRVSDWTVKYQIPKKVNRFYRIEFSSDSRRIKVAPPEETQYWDLESGTRLWVGVSSNEALTSQNFRRYLDFPEGSPPVIRAIPDDQPFIVVEDPDATKVRMWDWVGDSVLLAFQSSWKDSALVIDASNGEVVTRIESTAGEVESIVLPDGTALALVVNSNGEAWVVKLPSGELKWRFSAAGQKIVRVGIIHTVSHAYTVDELGVVQFWDLKDGQQLGRPMSRGYGASSYAGETADYWWIWRDSFKREGGDTDIWIKDSSSLIATLKLGEYGPLEKVIGKAGGLYKIDRDWQGNPSLYRLCRPAFWYGFLWLPEFYLTLVLALGLAWSLWHDRKL